MILSKLSDIREVFNGQRWRFNNPKFVRATKNQLRRIMLSHNLLDKEMASELLEDIQDYITHPEIQVKKKPKKRSPQARRCDYHQSKLKRREFTKKTN